MFKVEYDDGDVETLNMYNEHFLPLTARSELPAAKPGASATQPDPAPAPAPAPAPDAGGLLNTVGGVDMHSDSTDEAGDGRTSRSTKQSSPTRVSDGSGGGEDASGETETRENSGFSGDKKPKKQKKHPGASSHARVTKDNIQTSKMSTTTIQEKILRNAADDSLHREVAAASIKARAGVPLENEACTSGDGADISSSTSGHDAADSGTLPSDASRGNKDARGNGSARASPQKRKLEQSSITVSDSLSDRTTSPSDTREQASSQASDVKQQLNVGPSVKVPRALPQRPTVVKALLELPGLPRSVNNQVTLVEPQTIVSNANDIHSIGNSSASAATAAKVPGRHAGGLGVNGKRSSSRHRSVASQSVPLLTIVNNDRDTDDILRRTAVVGSLPRSVNCILRPYCACVCSILFFLSTCPAHDICRPKPLVATGGVRQLSQYYDTSSHEQVGKGTYGDVFKAVSRTTGERVAVKHLRPLPPRSDGRPREGIGLQVRREDEMWAAGDHCLIR